MTTFTLTLAPVGDGPPMDLRIESLTALRRHRLRCPSIQAPSPHQTAQDATAGMRMSRQPVPPENTPESLLRLSGHDMGQRRIIGRQHQDCTYHPGQNASQFNPSRLDLDHVRNPRPDLPSISQFLQRMLVG